MNNSDFECAKIFAGLAECYHLCTPEDFDLVFANTEDFKYGMSLIGLCSKVFPDIKLLTFELMSNHMHLVLAGKEDRITSLFCMIKKFLVKHFTNTDRWIHWDKFSSKLIKIESLENFRNVIAYVNRNGFVVHPEWVPFSYPWGANRFYFCPEAKIRHKNEAVPMKQISRQTIAHSRKFDYVEGLMVLDGYVSPISFCDIDTGESLFRNARQYFIRISKSVESYKDIADVIGESIYYTDDDLFMVAKQISSAQYNEPRLPLLPYDSKIKIAKTLHFNYNASNKQIQRLLSLDAVVVSSLFPG